MITDSYNASCYIENKDGQYHMECAMNYGDENFYSDYNGDDFVNGLNTIMGDITTQMPELKFKSQPQPEPQESLEDKVKRLEDSIAKLQEENNYLNEYINILEDQGNSEYKCKKSNQDDKNYKFDIDEEAIKHFNDFVNRIINNKKKNSDIYELIKF